MRYLRSPSGTADAHESDSGSCSQANLCGRCSLLGSMSYRHEGRATAKAHRSDGSFNSGHGSISVTRSSVPSCSWLNPRSRARGVRSVRDSMNATPIGSARPVAACCLHSPASATERQEMCSTLALRASATISSVASGGTSSACRIRSTSTTLGIVFPRSIRLILACDMAQRTASLSPERPAALRSFRSVSARSLLARRASGSILIERYGLFQRQVSPLEALRRVGRIDDFSISQGAIGIEVQQHHH